MCVHDFSILHGYEICVASLVILPRSSLRAVFPPLRLQTTHPSPFKSSAWHLLNFATTGVPRPWRLILCASVPTRSVDHLSPRRGPGQLPQRSGDLPPKLDSPTTLPCGRYKLRRREGR